MQRLEVSGAVRPLHGSLDVTGLTVFVKRVQKLKRSAKRMSYADCRHFKSRREKAKERRIMLKCLFSLAALYHDCQHIVLN